MPGERGRGKHTILTLHPIAVHADWSVDPRKRWMALADPAPGGWAVGVMPVGELATLLPRLLVRAEGAPVALGLDCPIGLPRAYAALLGDGTADFPAFLDGLTAAAEFFRVCDGLEDVALGRPFYPRRGQAGMTRAAFAAPAWAAACRAVPRLRPRNRGPPGRGAAVLDAGRQPGRQGRGHGLAGPAVAGPGRPGAADCCGRSTGRCWTCWRRVGSPGAPCRRVLPGGGDAAAWPADERQQAAPCRPGGAGASAAGPPGGAGCPAGPGAGCFAELAIGMGADAGRGRPAGLPGWGCWGLLQVLVGAPGRCGAGRPVGAAMGGMGAWDRQG